MAGRNEMQTHGEQAAPGLLARRSLVPRRHALFLVGTAEHRLVSGVTEGGQTLTSRCLYKSRVVPPGTAFLGNSRCGASLSSGKWSVFPGTAFTAPCDDL